MIFSWNDGDTAQDVHSYGIAAFNWSSGFTAPTLVVREKLTARVRRERRIVTVKRQRG